MGIFRCLSITLAILIFQAWGAHSQCEEVKSLNGTISYAYDVRGHSAHTRCWRIKVPPNYYVHLSTKSLGFDTNKCLDARIQINLSGEKFSEFCSSIYKKDHVTSNSNSVIDVDVNFYVNSHMFGDNTRFSFRLDYKMGEGLWGIEGVADARINAIDWLKRKYTSFQGWKQDTPRAVTALYLSKDANFNGNMPDDMMAKQTELTTALALTQSIVSNQKLSIFINGLKATCLNPRRFYGHDLVQRLKVQVVSSGNFTHPAAYLALCNANEAWPERFITDIDYILSSDSDYHFVRDIQAYAIMALSCMINRTAFLNHEDKESIMLLYNKSINQIKALQLSDGSFGNAQTTALILQTLLASGQEFTKDWNLNASAHYLMKELSDTGVEFVTVYTALPALNRKSLRDLAFVNCAGSSKRQDKDDLPLGMSDYLVQKIRIQYSLYIGDEKDIVHTVSMRVPKNTTAYQFMQLAAAQNPKFEFKMKYFSQKMYVYEIAGLPNDPEEGTFWLLYLKLKIDKGAFLHSTANLEQLVLDDGEEFIMWYQTANI